MGRPGHGSVLLLLLLLLSSATLVPAARLSLKADEQQQQQQVQPSEAQPAAAAPPANATVQVEPAVQQQQAVPAATPEAVPAATPEAVPAATPEAVPAAAPEAVPAATPEAVPAAAPAAVPVPAATPQQGAVQQKAVEAVAPSPFKPPEQVQKAQTLPLLPFDPPAGPQPSVAICAIVKNQHMDLCEWLHYHQSVLNVSRIYFWDNNSKPPMHDIVSACSRPGVVVYRYMSNVPRTHSRFYGHPQLWAYNRCLEEFGGKHEFMAFIDADEFVWLSGGQRDLGTFLEAYRPYGCLALNWRVFGSSGHVRRPPGGVMENYRKCTNGQAQGRHTKCIVNTKFTLDAWNPHAFNFKPGYFCVNEDQVKTHIPYSERYAASRIALNHYVIKSREDYAAKRARGSAMGNFKVAEYFDITDRDSKLDCPDALALGHQVAVEAVALQAQLKNASSGDLTFWERIKKEHHTRLFPAL